MNWIIELIHKAFVAPEPRDLPQTGPAEERKELPYDSDRYIQGEASDEEEKLARNNGYLNARDMRQSRIRSKIAAHAERENHRRRELQTQLDLESVGVPADDLREMADSAGELPYIRERPPKEIQAPKDDAMRRARVAGMTNRFIELDQRLQTLGLAWDMSDDELPPGMRGRFLGMCYERHEIEKRMAAYGVVLGDVEEGIQEGRIQRVDRVDYEMMSNDPELRAIQEAYRKDAEEYEGKSSSEAPPDRLCIREDYRAYPGWKSLDDTGIRRGRPGNEGGDDDNSRQGAPRTPQIAPGPKGHIKAAEMELMRERLLELDELLDELGYARGTLRENVPPIDRDAFDRIMAEREHIRADMAGLCESMEDTEKQSDEDASLQHPGGRPLHNPTTYNEAPEEPSDAEDDPAQDSDDDLASEDEWGNEDSNDGEVELDWDVDTGIDGGGWE